MTTRTLSVLCLAIALAFAPALAPAASFPASLSLITSTSDLLAVFAAGGPVGFGSPLGGGLLKWTGGSMTMMVEQSPGDGPPALGLSAVSATSTMVTPTSFSTGLGLFLLTDNVLSQGLAASNDEGEVVNSGPFPIVGGTAVNFGVINGGSPKGLSNSLDAGDIDIAGGTFVIDLDTAPEEFNAPTPVSPATFGESGGPISYAVTLDIPFLIDELIIPAVDNPLGFDVWMKVTGVMHWAGTKTVPEPGTMALAVVGLIGLIPVARRFRKKS